MTSCLMRLPSWLKSRRDTRLVSQEKAYEKSSNKKSVRKSLAGLGESPDRR